MVSYICTIVFFLENEKNIIHNNENKRHRHKSDAYMVMHYTNVVILSFNALNLVTFYASILYIYVLHFDANVNILFKRVQ